MVRFVGLVGLVWVVCVHMNTIILLLSEYRNNYLLYNRFLSDIFCVTFYLFDQMELIKDIFGIGILVVFALAVLGGVIKIFEDIQAKVNPKINHVEQVKRFKLMPKEWTIEGKELTPTMKLRRKAIMEKYAKEVEELYKD